MQRQNHKIGDLVWIPEHSTLLWALKQERIIKKVLKTANPQVALIVSEFDENRFCIFLNEDYWIIEKAQVYEVPNVFDTRCSQ